MSAMGRPKKLKGGRTPYTMYLDNELRAAVDEYVFRAKQDNPGYSRSDFLNEAAEFYLAELNKRKDGTQNEQDNQA